MKATYFGFNPPFLSSSNVVMPMQTDERLIKNDILQLLLTVPGERAFRPKFGAPVKPTLFEFVDQFTINQLRNGILETMAANEPRVTVTDIRIDSDADNNLIRVKLFVALNTKPNVIFELDVDFPFLIRP